MVKLLKGAGAAIAGYATIVIGAVLSQDLLFGGVTFDDSTWFAIVVGGGLTVLAAVAGGYLAAWIFGARSGYRPLLPISILAGWLSFEGTYLYVNGITTGPLWFEFLAGASIVVAVLIGAFIYARSRRACPA